MATTWMKGTISVCSKCGAVVSRGEPPERYLYGVRVPSYVYLPPAYDLTVDDLWRLSAGSW